MSGWLFRHVSNKIAKGQQHTERLLIYYTSPCALRASSLEAVRAQKALLPLHLSCWWPWVPALRESLRTVPSSHAPCRLSMRT